EFSPPLSGHLLVVTGHLHDYGTLVKLVDAATGKTLVQVNAKRDSLGLVLSIPRKRLAIRGEGLSLTAGHRYRVVGVFDNPTRDTSYGAMAHMVGLFAPNHYREWPALDSADLYYRRDLVDLLTNGATDSVIVGAEWGVPARVRRSDRPARRSLLSRMHWGASAGRPRAR